MNLQHRINLLSRLGEYILSGNEQWAEAKIKAGQINGWFIPEFTNLAAENIARRFLQKDLIEQWTKKYDLRSTLDNPKKVGIIMAGNIPMVGFHDLLAVFISGHKAMIKLSSKDETLIKHLADKLVEWDPETSSFIRFEEMLKGCDAYIATGSNNSSRYFEYYFGKYSHIIRRNKTSVAILSGNETTDELEKLADDVYLFFGLGCRNVTKIYIPDGYDFIPLLESFKKYNWLADHYKYKNNYDYNLAIHILNNKYYMSNSSLLLVQEPSVFSPISQLNYEFYSDLDSLKATLNISQDLQCIVGKGFVPFGQAQSPGLDDFADGVNTMDFLHNL
jgi:Acyl-CoA reductase (LuxC)